MAELAERKSSGRQNTATRNKKSKKVGEKKEPLRFDRRHAPQFRRWETAAAADRQEEGQRKNKQPTPLLMFGEGVTLVTLVGDRRRRHIAGPVDDSG